MKIRPVGIELFYADGKKEEARTWRSQQSFFVILQSPNNFKSTLQDHSVLQSILVATEREGSRRPAVTIYRDSWGLVQQSFRMDLLDTDVYVAELPCLGWSSGLHISRSGRANTDLHSRYPATLTVLGANYLCETN